MNARVQLRGRIRDSVHQELRTQIIKGDLKPGQALRDVELTAKLGVGRTPLREALMLLAEEGLVTTYHRQGTFVTDVTLRDLQQAVEMRLALDALAVRLCIARATDSELERLESRIMHHRMPESRDEILTFDEEIHTQIVGLTQNQLLMRMWTRAYTVCARIKTLSLSPTQNPQVIRDELLQVVDAMKRRDVSAATEAVTQHLSSFQRALVEHTVG